MSYYTAINDFRRARRRAGIEQILASIQGKSIDLLSYEEVRKQLRGVHYAERGLQDIPVDAIIGTAGRYADFTRSFLPRQDSDEDRWSKVRVAQSQMEGLPPIEVYQIGEAYFVKDGHHRVSVARQLKATHIEAYVTEVKTKVPLQPKDRPGDLILKAEYAAFLERTGLDKAFPDHDFSVTKQGGTEKLFEHITVHRHFLGENLQREISLPEAVASWHQHVYFPVIEVIRHRGLLRDFPGRTEADLYLWVTEHKADLEQALAWEVDPDQAVIDLSEKGSGVWKAVSRVGKRVLDALTPDTIERGPSPGSWRRGVLSSKRELSLFTNLLVPIRGDDSSWCAIEQAIEISRKEGSRIHGLHVVSTPAEVESQEMHDLKTVFAGRLKSAEVGGKLAVEVGTVARVIADRSSLIDLIVVSLLHPPGSKPLQRLSSGFRTLVRRSGRPVMAIPEGAPLPSKLLLAYDDSPRSVEALFISAYMAEKWGFPLVVASVEEKGVDADSALRKAEAYLASHQVQATYVLEKAPVASTLLDIAGEHQVDFLSMGGYGSTPLVEVALGSNVDEILRCSLFPVLICS
jgi:nucleotide-binding universal stress UspA family protein